VGDITNKSAGSWCASAELDLKDRSGNVHSVVRAGAVSVGAVRVVMVGEALRGRKAHQVDEEHQQTCEVRDRDEKQDRHG
jgi:hypothetical protein